MRIWEQLCIGFSKLSWRFDRDDNRVGWLQKPIKGASKQGGKEKATGIRR